MSCRMGVHNRWLTSLGYHLCNCPVLGGEPSMTRSSNTWSRISRRCSSRKGSGQEHVRDRDRPALATASVARPKTGAPGLKSQGSKDLTGAGLRDREPANSFRHQDRTITRSMRSFIVRSVGVPLPEADELQYRLGLTDLT